VLLHIPLAPAMRGEGDGEGISLGSARFENRPDANANANFMNRSLTMPDRLTQ